MLLAHIVERAADQPYASFLAREIFEPLGMEATFAGSGNGKPALAAGHRAGTLVTSFELDTVGMGAGDVWSTVGDLARWERALASGEILAGASRRRCWRSIRPSMTVMDLSAPRVTATDGLSAVSRAGSG